MINFQAVTDKAAIGLSLLCMLHCLALPAMILLLPSATALGMYGESLHKWLLFAVIPTSIYALFIGCKKHERYMVSLVAFLGLCLLVMAVLLPIGEFGEKLFTVAGSIFLVFGHYKNYRLCRSRDNCECTDHLSS